ncbi:dioxygenase [Variovorax sp. HJSM1_2]|uniref:dioxygenase family protein n=1 Tax=Variovorax sp. HJSM1_2 TaxID=3366263 RepID=UPI003BE51301
MSKTTKFPSIFVSHGAPTFALEPGRAGPLLRGIGERLQQQPGLRAILVVSPHWQTRGLRVSTAAAPETVHDFGGFPAPLYRLRYPAQGAPAVAEQTIKLLSAAGLPVAAQENQGLDHGAWVPLLHMLPQADVPVFQLSLPVDLTAQGALQLGQALAPLREQGVAILASGSLTHNLYEFRHTLEGDQEPYVLDFVQWIRRATLAHNTTALVAYREQAPHAQRAHPSDEHYLPLLVAIGASSADESVEVIDGGVTYGVLSMEGYVFGDLPGAALSRTPQAAEAALV